jgi:hypothetical protein
MSLLTTLATPNLAPMAEDLHKALEEAQRGAGYYKKEIDLSRWVSFYYSNRKVLDRSLADICSAIPQLSNRIENVTDENTTALNLTTNDKGEEILNSLLLEFPNLEDNPKKELPPISDEGLFVFQVVLPCWLHHSESPVGLFRKSRLGNLDAMEMLLQIDKTVTADKRIARHLAAYGTKPQSPEYQRLARAMEGTPRKIKAGKVKTLLAAFLYGLAKSEGKPLSYRKIQDLFDQSAQERGIGEIDPDLTASPDSFAQHVRRNLHFWSKLSTLQK